jgi:hypothetical protein
MALYDWMKGEQHAPEKPRPARTTVRQEDRRTRLEVALACAGFVVWLLSAYEVLLVVLK